MIALILSAKNSLCSKEIRIMLLSIRAVATLASVTVLACSIFAIGWVGLALLGY